VSGYQNIALPVKLLVDRLNELNNPRAEVLKMSGKENTGMY